MNRMKASTHQAMTAASSGRGGALEGEVEVDHELVGEDGPLEEVAEVALEGEGGNALEGDDAGGPE